MSNPRTGCVVAFAGHMIDRPGRASARFPACSEAAVGSAIRDQLAAWGACEGVCSLACGADVLFAEAMLDRGGDIHIVLPIAADEFVRESVDIAGGGRWLERFERVRAKATTFEVYGGRYLQGSGTPFHVTTLLIDGLARIHAGARGVPARSLAVWDGKPGDGFGGTASFVGHSVMQARTIECIRPLDGTPFTPDASAIRAASAHSWTRLPLGDQTLEHRLVAMVFADARGFGALTEPQMPMFIREVLGAVRRAVAICGPTPLVLNTWGDGVFAVTTDIEHAGQLGLALVRECSAIDHKALGTTDPVTFRVGVHAGPAFVGLDPVTGRQNAYGADVSLAARIEPVVKPGEVWCSTAYAALIAATTQTERIEARGTESLGGLRFENVGEHELPKGAGQKRLWRAFDW